MIQLNLLPNVKLEFIKAERLKRTVLSVAGIVAAASLFLLILLFVAVNILQKQHLKNLDNEIKTDSAKLQSTTDIDKVLTIQNQLLSLPNLNAAKPVTSRLFGYLKDLVPQNVTMSTLTIDFGQHTISITGQANNLATVNKFVDTLKFTTYTTGANSTSKNVFSNVVLSNFGRTDQNATYTITVAFDGAIFDTANAVTLKVPKIVTTRSETERPTNLFSQPSTNSTGN